MFSIKNRLPCPSQQKIDKFKKGSMSLKVRLRKIPIIMYSFLLYLSPLYLSSRIFLPAEVSLSMGGCGGAYTEKEGRSPPSPRDFPLLLQEDSYKDRTSTFCIAQLFCVRSREWTRSILRTFCETSFAGSSCKNNAGLRSLHRDYFPFTRKVIKGVPKRRYPLWILL